MALKKLLNCWRIKESLKKFSLEKIKPLMKHCKVSSSVNQGKQQQKRRISTSLLSTCVMKKDTGTKVKSKSRMLKVRNQFSGRSRNWLKTRWPRLKWMKKRRRRNFPELNWKNFWTSRKKKRAKNTKHPAIEVLDSVQSKGSTERKKHFRKSRRHSGSSK